MISWPCRVEPKGEERRRRREEEEERGGGGEGEKRRRGREREGGRERERERERENRSHALCTVHIILSKGAGLTRHSYLPFGGVNNAESLKMSFC